LKAVEVEEEIIIPQDYLPESYAEMNETLHTEYKDFKFDTVVRGGQVIALAILWKH